MKRDAEYIQTVPTIPLEDPASSLACRVRELEFRNSELKKENAVLGRRYTDLFDNAPLASFTLDEKGRITRANSAGAELLGIPKQKLINTDLSIYVQGRDLNVFRRHRKMAGRAGGKLSETLSLVPGDRKPFKARLESFSTARLPGCPASVVTHILPEPEPTDGRDVRFEHLERELIQTQRLAAAGRVASVVAHEINSPLQGISSLLFLVKSGCAENRELLEYIEIIEKAFHDIRDKVKSLLNLKRTKKDTLRDLSVNDVVRETMALMGNLLMRKKIETRLELTPGLPHAHASFHSLVQVMVNLINNSIEAMDTDSGGFTEPPRGERRTLVISSALEDARIVLSIRDNGPGLSGSSLTELFDPFYTAKSEGTGIGLYICRKIITKHQGTITAANSDSGGACFTITLPVNRSTP